MAKQRQKYQILSKVLQNNLEQMPKTVEKKSMLPLVKWMEKIRQTKAGWFFFFYIVRKKRLVL